MPQAGTERTAGSELGEEDRDDDEVAYATPTATTPGKRRQDGNSSRKRRRQEPSASEIRYPRRRSTKACYLCRTRKTKCDNAQPTCGFCASIGATCSYGDGQSHSSFDAASSEILRTLGQLVDSQKDLLEAIRSNINHGPDQPDTGRSATWTSPRYGEYAPVAESACPLPDNSTRRLSRNSYYPASPVQRRPDSRPSLVDGSSDASGTNPAALRWFGLLANGVGRQALHTSHFEGEREHERDRDALDGEGYAQATPLQTATRIVDAPPDTAESNSPQVSFSGHVGQPDSASERQLWQAKNAIQLLPSEKAVFENFVRHSSLWIDIFDPRRHFSAVVPRLALYNAGLMNAILALSCHHMSLSHDHASTDANCENDALQYYYQTLHYVQKAMRHPSYQSSDELLATTLIISTYEMLAGSQKDWEQHLQGVFWILRSQFINVEIETIGSAVWWAWLRQDIWAAFREKRKTFTAWTPKKDYQAMAPHEISSRAIWHLAQVVNFCSPVGDPSDRSRLRERLDEVDRLKEMLNDWRQNLTVEFNPLPAVPEDVATAFKPLLIWPPCYGLAIQAHYVCKILLSFHEPSFGGVNVYLDRMASIQSWINTVCGVAMTLTDDASGILSAQCVFIAGMFTRDQRERQCVLDILGACRRRTGWPSYPLETELEGIWEGTRLGGTDNLS